jgi:HAD superfamily hydrolase (TIGR01549 family)
MAGLTLFDLDNTLLDREAAFAIWARRFLAESQLPPSGWAKIKLADADGFKPRDLFFGEIREEFGITTAVEDLLARYHVEYPACFSVEHGTVEAVRKLRGSGWMVGVVTNGEPSQRAKLEATDLVDEFDAICISALVGAWKPDVAIFEEAARMCGLPLSGWMVGDSASADMAGGRRAGLKTIWMARGRSWDSTEPAPDAIASKIPEAVEIILGSDPGQEPPRETLSSTAG